MESIKKLKEAADDCLKDLKSVESKISITEGNLAFMESKKVALGAEISAMEAKKASVMESIGTIEKEARAGIDARLAGIKAKEDQLTADRAELKTKLYQAAASKEEADQAKDKYATLYAECLTKVAELDEKKVALANVLGK